jgi:hypothetical protein
MAAAVGSHGFARCPQVNEQNRAVGSGRRNGSCENRTVGRAAALGLEHPQPPPAARPTIRYGAGALTIYVDDEVGRVTQIRHEDLSEKVLYQLDYVWNLNNTVYNRAETDNRAETLNLVTFTYDDWAITCSH